MNDDHAFHLTPLDVRSQEFARALRGYDRAQVDEFKLAISEELERLLRDRAQHAPGVRRVPLRREPREVVVAHHLEVEAEHRDTQAIQAKLDELLRSDPKAKTELAQLEADRTQKELVATTIRPAEALRSAPLLVGPAELCAERLAALVAAGARRVFVWPLGDEVRQLERFRGRVAALI